MTLSCLPNFYTHDFDPHDRKGIPATIRSSVSYAEDFLIFDKQPLLTSQLVELRPLRPADFNALYEIASDPCIWDQHPEPDRWKRNVFERFFDVALRAEGALVAIDACSGQTIGSSRFHGLNVAHREIEIGWTFLARSHWGGRYNGEMKRLMLEHAFAFVDTVIFVIGAHNYRSQAAVLKIGAQRAGSLFDEAGQERITYAVQRERYSKLRGTHTTL